MNTPTLGARLSPTPRSFDGASTPPTLASFGNNPHRYVKAMERHFADDVTSLCAHVVHLEQSESQSARLQTAFIDGSEALRDFLGIRNPNGFHKKYLSSGSSSPRIPDSVAPTALVMAATRSAKDARVQRSLARLEDVLRVNPPGHRATHEYQYVVESALSKLMQDLHNLPTDAARQKAIDLIAQHLPQLEREARTHIVSLARDAMGRQNIGDKLKIRLQELIQSRGTAKLADILNKEKSTQQPERTENRGKARFTAILKKSSVAVPQSRTVNQAKHPDMPIKLTTYSGYGAVQVQCTDYARQAAELLIDRNGELDGSHIPRMLDQLKTDKTLPAEHRRHLMRTLDKLKQGGELGNTINSICQDKPLKGGAADVVRGTLDLPLEHAPTKEDARKAVVMSLLGYLRQGNVGSCFATAEAICLLDSSPEVVARDMKELLEDHKLTFQQDGVLVEAPLNLHIYQQDEVTLRADGSYTFSLNGLWPEHHKLVDSPGMQAALNALGIPENERQAAITGALSQMGYAGRRRIPLNENLKKIIEYLARTTPGTTDPDKKLTAALRAFNGKQDVGLLRAWEYTLATSAQTHRAMTWNPLPTSLQKVCGAVFFSMQGEIPGRPELQSPAGKSVAIQAQLCSDPRFRQTDPAQIIQHLFNEIVALFEKQFVQQYDMNISLKKKLLSEGVSTHGGFTLYEKIPADNPSQWKRIDNADAFQEAMARLVIDASETAHAHIDGIPGDPETKQEALRLIADHVVASIQDKTFIEHAVLQMNPGAANQPLGNVNHANCTPWQQAQGCWPDTIITRYGGKLVHHEKVFPTTSPTDVSLSGTTQSSAVDDITPLVNFFYKGLTKMAPELQAKAQESPDGFKIPVSSGTHVFSLMPMEMKELWANSPVTLEQWIDDNLKQPAMKWLKSVKVLTDKTPAKIIADTNWVTNDGRSQYLGILYNPFTHKVEAKIMNPNGTGRQSIKKEEGIVAKDTIYTMFTPLTNKTKPQVNNQ